MSTGAVSYALNGRPGVSSATRQRIQDIADEIGWRPSIAARALSASRAHAVGLVIVRPPTTIGAEPFYMRLVAGIEGELSRRRIALLLQLVSDHDTAIESIHRWWGERRVDGVLLTDVRVDDPRLGMLEQHKIPAVLIGRPHAGRDIAAVWSDEAPAVAAAIDHLVGLGHRRIARVAGMPGLDHTLVRTQSFLIALAGHGLEDGRVIETDYSWEAGAAATRTLLQSQDRPTAIIFDNDVMAVAALAVARDLGVSVPTELSIVAGEDSQLCEFVSPSVTALSRDIVVHGKHAARILLAVVDGHRPGSFQDQTAHLTPRQSTAPIHTGA